MNQSNERTTLRDPQDQFIAQGKPLPHPLNHPLTIPVLLSELASLPPKPDNKVMDHLKDYPTLQLSQVSALSLCGVLAVQRGTILPRNPRILTMPLDFHIPLITLARDKLLGLIVFLPSVTMLGLRDVLQ